MQVPLALVQAPVLALLVQGLVQGLVMEGEGVMVQEVAVVPSLQRRFRSHNSSTTTHRHNSH